MFNIGPQSTEDADQGTEQTSENEQGVQNADEAAVEDTTKTLLYQFGKRKLAYLGRKDLWDR